MRLTFSKEEEVRNRKPRHRDRYLPGPVPTLKLNSFFHPLNSFFHPLNSFFGSGLGRDSTG